MTPKRKKVEEFILNHVNNIDKTGKNGERYKKKFAKMSDADFDEFMRDIRDGNEVLFIYAANMVDHYKVADLRDYATKIGVKLFERIRMWDQVTQSYYLTSKEYFVIQAHVRRFSQFVDHKLSVAEGDKQLDVLTGQVCRGDRAGGISQTEIQSLYARGMEKTILELLKYRGGDITALAEFRRELEEQGRTTISRDTGSIPRSAIVLDQLLSAAHIESNAGGGVV